MAINARNAVNATTTPVRDMLRALWIGVSAILIAIVVMWVFNIMGLRGFVVPIALVGTLLIAMVGFRATNVVGFGIFGAIIGALKDKDKSQGAATGLLWLTRLVIAMGMGFVFSAFTLMTWSFQQFPGGFWVLFFGVTLILLVQQHWHLKTNWAPWILMGYAIACIFVGAWLTFGGAYTGHVADIRTGEPLFMMDPISNMKIDGITPADCRYVKDNKGRKFKIGHTPKDTAELRDFPHLWESGVFNYAEQGSCWTPGHPGVRAVPFTGEEATKRNPVAWTSAMGDQVYGKLGATGLGLLLGGLVVIIIMARHAKQAKGILVSGAALFVIVGFLAIVFSAFTGRSPVQAWEWLTLPSAADRGCVTIKTGSRMDFHNGERTLDVCRDSGGFNLVAPGRNLGLEIDPEFREMHREELVGLTAKDFVHGKCTHRIQGSCSYTTTNRYLHGWNSSGLDKLPIRFFVTQK